MTDNEFIDFVARNRQQIRLLLSEAPMIYGDVKRVKFNSRFNPHDLLINTMSGDVVIGEDVFFGHDVMLLTGTHDTDKLGVERIESVPTRGRDIIIEKGAWIASRAIVLGPCRIGQHAVVASGSVVKTDVEPFAIYAGNPARKVAMVGQAAP
jgi:acetyltransferase-like isoleucine patch superfamily enzyme